MTPVAVVLAAGASRRMGRPKALLPLHGSTFVGRIVSTLRQAGLASVIVVTRAELAEAVDLEVGSRACVAVNPTPDEGMQSSIQTGLQDVGTRPVLLALVDQPHVTARTVRLLLEAHQAAPDRIIVPRSKQNRRGHPVIFPADLVSELREAHAEGAREVVWRHVDRVLEVPIVDPAAFSNVNTPQDFAALQAETQEGKRRSQP